MPPQPTKKKIVDLFFAPLARHSRRRKKKSSVNFSSLPGPCRGLPGDLPVPIGGLPGPSLELMEGVREALKSAQIKIRSDFDWERPPTVLSQRGLLASIEKLSIYCLDLSASACRAACGKKRSDIFFAQFFETNLSSDPSAMGVTAELDP